MIEFIIPLNLPVRAVAVTESAANAPHWLADEMNRWAIRQQPPEPIEEMPVEPAGPLPPTELELALESLRVQSDLFNRATDELRRVAKVVEKRLDGTLEEFRLAAIELAHAIAAKLTFEAAASDRFPIENLVHEAMSRLDTKVQTVVRLHPDDLAYLEQFPQIATKDDDLNVEFAADSTLSRGDCKAKAGEMSVIYSLRQQAEEIRRHLLSTVSGHAET